MKKILMVVQVIDEDTGAIEDANTTEVSGQSQANVDTFIAALTAFGQQMTQAALATGANGGQIKQHRHGKHHGKP